MTSEADVILVEGLGYLRHRIEQTINSSLRNCLSTLQDGSVAQRPSFEECRSILASEVLAKFAEQAVTGAEGRAAYSEYRECCDNAGVPPHNRSVYDQVVRAFFLDLSRQLGADNVLRLRS